MFRLSDLYAVEALLASAKRVVPMYDIFKGDVDPDVIGLRHDIDDNPGSLETAVQMAKWEEERGFASTFFFLHSASYFEDDVRLQMALESIAERGHEIGIHTNAITMALCYGDDPDVHLAQALYKLRRWGHRIYGVAAHGDRLCHTAHYVNDEHFLECARPEYGEPDRVLVFGPRKLRLKPRPMARFGLLYDTHRLLHGRYLSDSGGRWNEAFPGEGSGQLHVLQHPDWWGKAFAHEGQTVAI